MIKKAINEFYLQKERPRISDLIREMLGGLAVSDIGPTGQQLARETFTIWANAVAELARESGMSQIRSRQFAEDWIARVQGSLILHAANGDHGPFDRSMARLLEFAKEKRPPEKEI